MLSTPCAFTQNAVVLFGIPAYHMYTQDRVEWEIYLLQFRGQQMQVASAIIQYEICPLKDRMPAR